MPPMSSEKREEWLGVASVGIITDSYRFCIPEVTPRTLVRILVVNIVVVASCYFPNGWVHLVGHGSPGEEAHA